MVTSVSVTLFIFARFVLALGEAGNFPAAIKTTAEYFPKKDRAFSTSIFNSGAQVGALIAPISIPVIAAKYGWEMAFIVIGAIGFIWMGFWIFMYKKPHVHPLVNKAELDYINQDTIAETKANNNVEKMEKKMSFRKCIQVQADMGICFRQIHD